MKTQLFLLFTVIGYTFQAQVVLTNRIAPVIGDSLLYAVDSNSTGVTITAPGPNQNWDFSQLNPLVQRTELYLSPAQGVHAASFPNATVMGLQGGTEQYYRVFNNRIALLGNGTRGGGLPIPGLGGANVFPNPAIIQRFPEQYKDTLSYTINYSVSFPSSIIPDSLLNQLPLKPDSFRVNINTRFHKEADAWGSLKLPAKTWNVLREKRITTSNTTLDAYISQPFPLGWRDVTQLVSGLFPGLFGNIRTYSYAFVSGETKGLIALVNVDSLDNINGTQFKPDDKILLKTDYVSPLSSLQLFPNPAQDQLYFSTDNLPSGNYYLQLLEPNGKLVLNQKISYAEGEHASISLGKLSPGEYIFQVLDRKSKKWIAQKLIIE